MTIVSTTLNEWFNQQNTSIFNVASSVYKLIGVF